MSWKEDRARLLGRAAPEPAPDAPAWPGMGIRWAGMTGWLVVTDPATGEEHEVEARDCPRRWIREAMRTREIRP